MTEREPLPPDANAQLDELQERIHQAVRTVLAEAGLSQQSLGLAVGKSQPSVSHMLTRRGHGITVREVAAIEMACRIPPGAIFRVADVFNANKADKDDLDLELAFYDDPDIDPHAAAVLSAGVHAARALTRQERRRR